MIARLLLYILLLVSSSLCKSDTPGEDEIRLALIEYLKRFDSSTKQEFRDQCDRIAGNMFLDSCFQQNHGVGTSDSCGVSILKGRRVTQEDNVRCITENQVPSLSGKNRSYSLLAVFDGHGGNEASVLSANCFHDYFLFHVYNITATVLSSPEALHGMDCSWQFEPVSSTDWQESYIWRIVLKEALRKAIFHTEEMFFRIIKNETDEGGTTASIAIETDGHLLVANVGDSKALICSSSERDYETLYAEELTVDHHPDRSDERLRIEASGGYVEDWGGIPRVVGVLAVSRSIGDVSLKKYGVISEPEFSDWRKLNEKNKYLVVASDGIFEKMTTQDVCAVIEAVEAGKDISRTLREKFLMLSTPIALPPPQKETCAAEHRWDAAVLDDGVSSSEQADFIQDLDSWRLQKMATALCDTALKLGSADNMAAIVYPLGESAKELDKQTIASTDIAPEFFNFPELVADSTRSYMQAGILMGREGAHFCYSLMEPLKREVISHVQYDIVGGSLEKALTPAERLCFSFSGPVCEIPRDESRGQLPARVHFISDRKLFGFIDRIASVPFDAESFLTSHSFASGLNNTHAPFTVQHYRYILTKKFARGSFGEIWLAVRKECAEKETTACDWRFVHDSFSSDAPVEESEIFVLKQILLQSHPGRRLSGLREKYFGEIFMNVSISQRFVDDGLNHVARFVDSFVVQDRDLWLVFKKEGQSLSRLLYESEEVPGYNKSEASFQVLNPSAWWRWLKSTEAGQHEMRSLLHQLLLAIRACHDRNITHRDIKPENMVVQAAAMESTWPMNLTLRIIDFGSAIDPFTLEHLYGPTGPTRSEHTPEYSPPEALLLEHWMHLHPHETKAYDIWSVGVIMLEMILGTPHVFQISARTRVLLDRDLAAWDQESRNVAYMLRAFMEMCILLPRVHPQHNRNRTINHQEDNGLALIDCSEAALLRKIQQRDPLGLGVPNVSALRLLRHLLQWYPEDRISVEEALRHPYFHPE